MKVLNTILMALVSLTLFGQSAGTIAYTEVIKLELESPDGMDLGDMMPESLTAEKELVFNKDQAVYLDAKDNASEETEISSDDGSFKMVFKTATGEEIFHSDLKTKSMTNSTNFMGKDFLIEEPFANLKWKISNEKIKYLGYVCQKATTIEPAVLSDEKDKEIVAWFTTAIPVSIGPAHYNSLPGAILMVSVDEGKREYKATEIDLTQPEQNKLVKPTKGKKVTGDEYNKIVEEKMKEMDQMHGSRRIEINRG